MLCALLALSSTSAGFLDQHADVNQRNLVDPSPEQKDIRDIEDSLNKVEADVIDIEKGLKKNDPKEFKVIAFSVCLIGMCCLWRCLKCLCRCGSSRSGYSHVSHQLDDEEETFKKSIELAEVDQLFNFDDDANDANFDEDGELGLCNHITAFMIIYFFGRDGAAQYDGRVWWIQTVDRGLFRSCGR